MSTTPAPAGLALPVTDEALAERLRARMQVVEEALAGHVRSRAVRDRAASHLMDAGGKRFRPLLVLLAAETGDRPDSDERDHRRVRRGADPPGLALPRRRDGRGRAAPRRRLGQRPLGQPRRDPHRRLPVLEVLRADRRARRRTPCGSRRRRSPGWSRARSWRPSGRGAGEDPLEHYLEVVAGKTGSLIATSARYGALLRWRHAARSRRRSRRTARSSARPSSSPTTSSTSPPSRASPARRPAPTCARACRRCRC